MEKRNYIFIDALRAYAVIHVLLVHIFVTLKYNDTFHGNLLVLIHAGFMGVDLFFVISGFVISLSILRGIENQGAKKFVSSYIRHRLARIAPLYILTSIIFITFVDAVGFWQKHNMRWCMENIISHILFIHNWFLDYTGSINGAAWSLGVEMQFYVIIILTIILWKDKPPLALALLGISIAVPWRAFCAEHWRGDVIMILYTSQQIFGSLDAFFAGAGIALIVHSRNHFLHRYIVASWRNTAIWFMLFILFSILVWHIYYMYPYHTPSYWERTTMVAGWRSLLALTLALFLLSAITLPVRVWLVRALAPLLYIGKISYGIYLWHFPVIYAFMKTGLPRARMAVLIIFSTLLLASFSWHFFEKPLIDKYRK